MWQSVRYTLLSLPKRLLLVLLFLSLISPFVKEAGAEDAIRTRDPHVGTWCSTTELPANELTT